MHAARHLDAQFLYAHVRAGGERKERGTQFHARGCMQTRDWQYGTTCNTILARKHLWRYHTTASG